MWKLIAQEFEGEQPSVLERINSNPKKLEG
jgi:hypothetical protein